MVLLALIVVVPSSFPNVSAQVSQSGNLPWLHVEGGRILDEAGSVVVLRGVAVEDPYFLKYIEKRFDGRDFMELSQNWHVNVIRVPVCPDLWEHHPDYTQELLDPIVEWGRQYGIYILLGWHAHGNPITGEVSIPDWGNTPPWSGNPYNPNMTLATMFWNEVAERYKDAPWVIYSVFNEPVYLSWQEWRPVAEQLVDVIQSHNPRATVLVPGVNWGYDLRGTGNDPVQRQNIVYETHPYPGQGNRVGPWETFFGYLAGSYPLFAGEWGFVPGSSNWNLDGTAENYGIPLLEYMAALGMSWTGWAWSPSWSPQMLQDWNYLSTEFGQVIKDTLAIAPSPIAPPTYSVTFYSDPTTGSIAVDGIEKVSGSTGIYESGARVHVVANPPSGYSFAGWKTNGISVDDPSSSDTYMTVSGSGSLEASFGLPQVQVTVKSKTTLGAEFSGVRITVDKKYYSTSFSLVIQGKHSFAAPGRVTVDGVKYTFVRWEDESGNALSTAASFSYSIQSSKTMFAVYSPPQYSITVYANDAQSRKAIAGASVYLDGNLIGTTNSKGYLVLTRLYPGAHGLTIHKDGYVDYVTTISLSRSTTLRAYLNRVS